MKSPVLISAKYQFSTIIVATIFLWFVGDAVFAKSYALGGITYAGPNLYFVYYAFRYSGNQNVPLIARSFAWGESGKFVLAAVGFLLIYRFVDLINHLGIFAGFVSMVLIQLFVATRINALQLKEHSKKA